MEATKVLERCVAKLQSLPTIRPGSSGTAVRTWQGLMQKEMQAKIKVDGFFGNDTRAATVAFQRKVGLPADGVVGSRTWAAAAVAPCYALALSQSGSLPAAASGKMMAPPQVHSASHGLGDFSFSVLDMKSVMLGAVLGVGAGFVLFRRK